MHAPIANLKLAHRIRKKEPVQQESGLTSALTAMD